MTETQRLEQACEDNNHSLIRELIDSQENEEAKGDVYQRIILYYENRKAVLPVGYVILFIRWLFKNHDFNSAGKYIEKLKELGVIKKGISDFIYESVIKPDESFYKERFGRNLEILVKKRILIKL